MLMIKIQIARRKLTFRDNVLVICVFRDGSLKIINGFAQRWFYQPTLDVKGLQVELIGLGVIRVSFRQLAKTVNLGCRTDTVSRRGGS